MYAEATRDWLETVVIGLDLCPFAKRELVNNRVRFSVTDATSELHLLQALESELQLLFGDELIETTLLIHPDVLGEFSAYNQFLDLADGLLAQMNLEGVFQIASFHPDYQFEGTLPGDAENYTNRSPYPTLHILREASLARAIDATPDIDEVPTRNIAKMRSLSAEELKALFRS
ncbi:MAG: DUF1415 domain-containing protein [Woeseiaceae bacterium]